MNEREPQPPDEREPLGRRVLRSLIAPDVLQDGGRDAPLSARGRLLFWGTIVVLVLAVSILFVITLTSK